MTQDKDPLDRAIELALYAPLGLGLFLKDTAPSFLEMFVARGRAEVDRRQQEVSQRVTTARSMGQVAMAFGVPMVRERVQRQVTEVRARAEGLLGDALGGATPAGPAAPEPAPDVVATAPAPQPPAEPPASGAGTSGGGDTGDTLPESATLPIPGYDALSASQVVERLAGLAHDELEAVREYEAAHRKRRTVLGKIEQLAS